MQKFTDLDTQQFFRSSNTLSPKLGSQSRSLYSPGSSYTRLSPSLQDAQCQFLKSQITRLKQQLDNQKHYHQHQLSSIQQKQEKVIKNINQDKQYTLQLEISTINQLQMALAQQTDESTQLKKELSKLDLDHSEKLAANQQIIRVLKSQKKFIQQECLEPSRRELEYQRTSIQKSINISGERISQIRKKKQQEQKYLKLQLQQLREESAKIASQIEENRKKLFELSTGYENSVKKTHIQLVENQKQENRQEDRLKLLKEEREKHRNKIQLGVQSLMLLKHTLSKEVERNKELKTQKNRLERLTRKQMEISARFKKKYKQLCKRSAELLDQIKQTQTIQKPALKKSLPIQEYQQGVYAIGTLKQIVIVNILKVDIQPAQKGKNKPKPKKVPRKYWKQRYDLFSKFDQGIQLDQQSWYSVTHQKIASHIAEECKNFSKILDGFAGAGGNVIQFAKYAQTVALDIDRNKLEMLYHNSKIYGVQRNIRCIEGDFLVQGRKQRADLVFMSPPWGGPQYQNVKEYNIFTHITPSIKDIVRTCACITRNIVLYLPRKTDIRQIVKLFKYLDGFERKFEIQMFYFRGHLKSMACFIGDMVEIDPDQAAQAILQRCLVPKKFPKEFPRACWMLSFQIQSLGLSEALKLLNVK